jgi:hypothetical protein
MRNFDVDAVLQRLAERRIEEAMREGKFDNLPGSGKPVDMSDMPADENARMMWWALRMMRQGGATPEETRSRGEIATLKAELANATTAARVRTLVAQVNALVRDLNTSPHPPNPPVAPFDLQDELHRLAKRRAAANPPPSAPPPRAAAMLDFRPCINKLCETPNPAQAQFCRRCGARVLA